MAAVALSLSGRSVPDRAVRWSLAGHGLLLLLVLIGGLTIPRSPPPTQLAIKATVVDPDALRPTRTALKPRPEPKPTPNPEVKPEPKSEPKPEPKPEDRKIEQQQKQQVKVEAERLKTEKLKAEKLKAEQLKTEQLKAERLNAEKLKAEKLKDEAAQREIARQLDEEERLLAATESGALADYLGMISQKVNRNWIRPPSAGAGLECEVVVTQIPGGEVVGVRIERCNADAAVRRSIEAAVLKASPLPLPADAALFDRSLRFNFKPEQ